ncbi:2-dehydro-3-deoxygalactonokinase [Shewanella corallii]|uniref:2-dehydro-3-deoxygalactonokinase n=1 Tax=Shewanella corallii TaxID=560080 RepID=A0ABT0N5M0_9GAMM|nr:2-dehydro-3-deoxygalactonokinase [Shewanella corallii]
MTAPDKVIVVDWGASCLRAYLCLAVGKELTVLDSVSGPGVTKAGNDFEAVLTSVISSWSASYGGLPVLMSGHIGSNLGWHEAPYVFCPVSPVDVALHAVSFMAGIHKVYVIPGVSCADNDQHMDVMRGEEIHVLGWLKLDSRHEQGTHLLCLPGTHTKWVLVKDGVISMVKTAITGELYDLLCHQSVLIQQAAEQMDMCAFQRGAKLTLESENGQFVHGLFSVRTLQVLGRLKPEEASSYLSGLLIGSDIRAALMAQEWRLDELASITLIGSPPLCGLFETTMKMKQLTPGCVDDKQTCLSGFSAIYRAVLKE